MLKNAGQEVQRLTGDLDTRESKSTELRIHWETSNRTRNINSRCPSVLSSG